MRTTDLLVPGFDAVYRLDEPTGFVALHRCQRAAAFGGTRVRAYASEDDALRDALRLGEAMTRKYAINELPFGGGKAVLVEQAIGSRTAAFRALGDFVESLAGRFITGSDLGVTEADVQVMATRTRYIECRDGAEATSDSVFHAMRAALRFWRSSESMRACTVAIQGVGAVGSPLAARCVEAGARVVVCYHALSKKKIQFDYVYVNDEFHTGLLLPHPRPKIFLTKSERYSIGLIIIQFWKSLI